MKKSTLWVLVAIMILSFVSLLYLQVGYISEMVRMRNEQFDESVRRSLYDVAQDVEQDETRRWLTEEFNSSQADASNLLVQDSTAGYVSRTQHFFSKSEDGKSFSSTTIRQRIPIDPKVPKLSVSKLHGANSISNKSKSLQEEMSQRYIHQRYLVDEVIWQMLYQASDRPLRERVNFKVLDDYLKAELLNNGIKIPYHFAVIDKTGKEVYRCSDYENKGEDYCYYQVLFPNDPPAKISQVRVHFPARSSYIRNSIEFTLPSLIFTVVLLFTFIFTIYNLFKQKKLTEMRNDFINNMTHEFKTPISTISLAAQMLNDGAVAKSPKMFQHISQVINDETKRLRFQVEKVLQMSMFDKQKVMLKKKDLDVHEIIENVTNTFSLKVESYGGKIETNLRAGNPVIVADEMHFTNVLFNLMDNAVKYRKEEVPLELVVSSWNDQNKLFISIEDNGLGIKKENVKKIFDRFYRVHTGNRHDVKGFGLGLAYVKRVIEEHKGSIKAESELKVGTKFIITLPLLKKN